MTSASCPALHTVAVGSAGSSDPRSPCLDTCNIITCLNYHVPHLAFVVFTYSPHSGTLPPHGVPPASPHESGQIFSSKYFLIPKNIFPRTYDGRGARGAPGVVFVDVILGARLGRPVDRPLLGLVDGRLLREERKGYMIQINLKLTVYMRKQSKNILTLTLPRPQRSTCTLPLTWSQVGQPMVQPCWYQ